MSYIKSVNNWNTEIIIDESQPQTISLLSNFDCSFVYFLASLDLIDKKYKDVFIEKEKKQLDNIDKIYMFLKSQQTTEKYFNYMKYKTTDIKRLIKLAKNCYHFEFLQSYITMFGNEKAKEKIGVVEIPEFQQIDCNRNYFRNLLVPRREFTPFFKVKKIRFKHHRWQMFLTSDLDRFVAIDFVRQCYIIDRLFCRALFSIPVTKNIINRSLTNQKRSSLNNWAVKKDIEKFIKLNPNVLTPSGLLLQKDLQEIFNLKLLLS